MGPVEVAADRYWGAQTERSLHHFKIGAERFPRELIRALRHPQEGGGRRQPRPAAPCPPDKADAIIQAADEVIAGKLDDHFPLVGLADRQRHADQHERQRGDLEPRHRDRSAASSARRSRSTPTTTSTRASPPTTPSRPRCTSRPSSRRASASSRRSASCATRSTGRRRSSPASSRSAARTSRTPSPMTLGQEISGWVAQLDHAIAAHRGRAAAPPRARARRHRGRHGPERARRASAIRSPRRSRS